MKKIIVVFLLFYAVNISAQTPLSQSKFNLGNISKSNEDVVDLVLGNYGVDDLYLLRVVAEEPTTTKYTSKTIPSNSSSILRIKLNPKEKGKIKRKVLLYFSDSQKPTEITLTANVEATPKNRRQACPSFNSEDMARKRANAYQQNQSAKIKRYHLQVGEASKNEQPPSREEMASQSTTKQNRTPIPSIEEQRKSFGKRETDSPRGALHNKKDDKAESKRQTPEERRNSPSVLDKLFGDPEGEKNTAENENTASSEKQPPLPKQKEKQIKTTTPRPNVAEKDVLLSDNYRPNSIVFLIDASNSMTKMGRMDLLKATMTKLLTPLRDIDSLSIITYSGDARILIKPTSGIEKEKIAETINNIKAEGSTQAAKGLSTAIDVGLSSFISEGNNQIVLATDGDFDIGSANSRLRRKIKKAAQKGLTTSVVGIKNDWKNRKAIKEIKDLGMGELITINKEKQTSAVLEMVKKQAIVD